MTSPILFDDLLKERRAWFKLVKRVFCPCLKKYVRFNSQGFRHLRYDGLGKARSKKEQKYRMGILPLSIPVIKRASSVFRYKKEYSKRFGKYIEYWALREVVGKQCVTVTVVLRKVGTGNITFYSIMKKGGKTKRRRR